MSRQLPGFSLQYIRQNERVLDLVMLVVSMVIVGRASRNVSMQRLIVGALGKSQMFSRAAARLLFPNQRLQRWCFDVELIYLADKLDIPVCEVAVNWTEIPGRVLFTGLSFVHQVLMQLHSGILGRSGSLFLIQTDCMACATFTSLQGEPSQ